jgi:valyl-tRNA synthetase
MAARLLNSWRNSVRHVTGLGSDFTMDKGLSKAVREVFVRLYEKGLIYQRRLYCELVSHVWDDACLTSKWNTRNKTESFTT